MFILYSDMIKWNSIKTSDGFNLKFPQKLTTGRRITPTFDEYSQIISVKENGIQLGRDMLIKEKERIKCVDIEVNQDSRKKGIGGLLHAISVMMMKENKSKNIYLDSLPEAIKFHFNKGFRTDCANQGNARICLNSVITSNTVFEDLKIQAKNLSRSLGDKSSIDNVNKLYDEYLRRVIQCGISVKDAALPKTLPMDLKLKDLKQHAEMYNGILEKFGIDYTI